MTFYTIKNLFKILPLWINIKKQNIQRILKGIFLLLIECFIFIFFLPVQSFLYQLSNQLYIVQAKLLQVVQYNHDFHHHIRHLNFFSPSYVNRFLQ